MAPRSDQLRRRPENGIGPAVLLAVVIAATVFALTAPDKPRAVALHSAADRGTAGTAGPPPGVGLPSPGTQASATGTAEHDAVSGWSLSAAALERRPDDIRAALRLMNTALAAHDKEGFVSVAGLAVPGFAVRQAGVYVSLSSAPFATVRYSWSGEWIAVPELGTRYGRPAVAAAVTRAYTLAPGWDLAPVGERLGLTFVFDGAVWALASDQDAAAVVSPSRGEPWGFGAVVTQRAGDVLVVGRGFSRTDLARLARRTRLALDQAGTVWPATAWNGRIVIYAVSDREFLQGWFGGSAGPGHDGGPGGNGAPAELEAMVHDVFAPAAGRQGAAAGVRVVVGPGLVTTDDSEHAVAVLRHEIGHLAAWTAERGPAPVWLGEGVAEYVAWSSSDGVGVDPAAHLERRGLPSAMWDLLRDPGYRPRLVPDDAFYAGDSAAVARNYADAWLTILYVADHFGPQRLRAFVEAASAPTEASPAGSALAAASTEVLGVTVEQLRDRAAAWSRQLRAGFA